MSEKNSLREENRQPTDPVRYASFAAEAGCVVYDRENPDAWIQSDQHLDAVEVR